MKRFHLKLKCQFHIIAKKAHPSKDQLKELSYSWLWSGDYPWPDNVAQAGEQYTNQQKYRQDEYRPFHRLNKTGKKNSFQ